MKKLLINFLKDNKVSFITSLCIVFIGISQTYKETISKGIGKIFLEIIMIIAIFIVSFLGGVIGEVLRKYTHPDEIYSYGFWNTLKNRVFWAIGPQVIGSFVALYIIFGLIF